MFNLFNKKKLGEAILKCPRCNVNMDKINKDAVIIDVCPGCRGMWLDDNEINKLLNFARKKKNGKKK